MKWIISAAVMMMLTFASTVSAHTGLTGSTPGDGEVVAEDIHEIALEFNSKIESTSTVRVFNDNEEEIIVSNIQVNNHMMSGAFMSPLGNGTYTVDWKIIGADGHPIHGEYSFVVSQEDMTDGAAAEKTPEISSGIDEESVEKPAAKKEVSAKVASNDVLVIILVILFTIAGGFFGWIIGRRQK